MVVRNTFPISGIWHIITPIVVFHINPSHISPYHHITPQSHNTTTHTHNAQGIACTPAQFTSPTLTINKGRGWASRHTEVERVRPTGHTFKEGSVFGGYPGAKKVQIHPPGRKRADRRAIIRNGALTDANHFGNLQNTINIIPQGPAQGYGF